MNLRFPSQYFDSETNSHYNYFRDYNPNIGRYIQRDPLGLAGGINLYAYVNGNPINYFDPTGEWGIAGAVVGGIAGAVGGYITGGKKGAAIGALVGAGIGAGVPFPIIAGAAASLIGQGLGLALEGEDWTDYCNYNLGAILGAGIGGRLGNYVNKGVSKYIAPHYGKVIGKPLNHQPLNRLPGDAVGAIPGGAVSGGVEWGGGQINNMVRDTSSSRP